jgi:PAS domain S-box-containing protein
MNHSGEAIFITDAHTGRFVDVNETACRWLGFSRERLLEMRVGDLDLEFPLESSDGVFDHVVETRDASRPKAFVRGSHRRRNGTSFPVEVALSQRRFGDRDFLLVVARDVKQRCCTEQTFLEGENERRGLFAISRDAGYCSARDGTVSEVNDSALDLFGYTRDEFLGLEARRLYCHPEHIRAFQRAVEEDGSVKNLHAEFQTKTGQSFRGFLGATVRYDSDGIVQGYQCFVSPVGETASLPSRAAAADTPPETHGTDTAKDEPASDMLSTDPGAFERDAERATREIEKARSEAATARADVEQAVSQAAKSKLDAEEATRRAYALEREAEQAKREIEKARSEAAEARLEAEHGMTEAAKAKLDTKEEKERADALQIEAEQAKREIEKARSETIETKLRVEEATRRAARAEAEAEAAQSKIEKAQLEVARAKMDAEQARSEAANAKLEADEAKERVQQLTREAESTMSETRKAVSEAADAWASLERAEREVLASGSATRAAASDPIVRHTGHGTQVHVKRRPTADTLPTGEGGPPVLAVPAVRHRRKKEPSLRPGRRKRPAVWLAVAAKAVAGLFALPSAEGRTGNRHP